MLLSIFLIEYDAAIQTIYQILATWQNALLFCEKGKIRNFIFSLCSPMQILQVECLAFFFFLS